MTIIVAQTIAINDVMAIIKTLGCQHLVCLSSQHLSKWTINSGLWRFYDNDDYHDIQNSVRLIIVGFFIAINDNIVYRPIPSLLAYVHLAF